MEKQEISKEDAAKFAVGGRDIIRDEGISLARDAQLLHIKGWFL